LSRSSSWVFIGYLIIMLPGRSAMILWACIITLPTASWEQPVSLLRRSLSGARSLRSKCAMPKKLIISILVIASCLASAFYFWSYRKASLESHSNTPVPVGYSLENYQTVEKQSASCERDSDCVLPMEYAIRSSCPFTAICVKRSCEIVCPSWAPTE
jgi:hypothetical protein